MILLDDDDRFYVGMGVTKGGGDYADIYVVIDASAKAQAKKILIKLQAIYNLPDEGMFHKRLGEFIQSLMEEVK